MLVAGVIGRKYQVFSDGSQWLLKMVRKHRQ